MNEYDIPFDNLLERRVQKGNDSDFLKQVYDQAYSMIAAICQSDDSKLENKEFITQSLNQAQNVIAFTGRHGTGKTSAMLTIAERLQSDDKPTELQGKAFFVLPYVDASMISGTKDIFLIILSSIQAKLKELKKRKILDSYRNLINQQKQVEQLEEKICALTDNYILLQQEYSLHNNTAYNIMEQLAERFNIRDDFVLLIKEFLMIQGMENGRIVICLDDIDMYTNNIMSILQCIHQYFMIPKIIVLITINIQRTTEIIQKNFFGYINTTEEKRKFHVHLVSEQADEYLRKIIPSDMRIVMPSWRKKEFEEFQKTRIVIDSNISENDISKFNSVVERLHKSFPKLSQSFFEKAFKFIDDKDNNKEKIRSLSPKELIMLMIAERTEIYLDSCGRKFHFVQPDSLRNLFDMFYLLYNDMDNLSNFKNKNDEYYQKRDLNRTILAKHLQFKMLPEYHFNSDIIDVITEYQEAIIKRKGVIVWHYFNQRFSEDKDRIINLYEQDFFDQEKQKQNIKNYCIGELYRIIYFSSRLQLFDRSFIKYILADLSFFMPSYYDNVKHERDTEDKKKANKDFRDTFLYSLLGTWNNDIFHGKKVVISIYSKQLELIKNNKKDLKVAIKQLVYLLLCISDSTRNRWNVEYAQDNAGNPFYIIDATIDPTAFLMNTLRAEERFNNMSFNLAQGDRIYTILACNDNENSKNKCYAISRLLTKIIQDECNGENCNKKCKNKAYEINKIIDNTLEELEKSDKNCFFLLSQTDLSYNVIKRAASQMIYYHDMDLKGKVDSFREKRNNKPFHIIKRFYDIIKNKLEENDNLYKTKYEEAFSENPIVKLFDGNYSDKLCCKKYIDSNGTKSFCGIRFMGISVNNLFYNLYKHFNDNQQIVSDLSDIKRSLSGETALITLDLSKRDIDELKYNINWIYQSYQNSLSSRQLSEALIKFLNEKLPLEPPHNIQINTDDSYKLIDILSGPMSAFETVPELNEIRIAFLMLYSNHLNKTISQKEYKEIIEEFRKMFLETNKMKYFQTKIHTYLENIFEPKEPKKNKNEQT